MLEILSNTDKTTEELLEGVNESKFKLEDVFSAYIAKCIRIAYLQGMKDFAELYVILKLDTIEDV